jgi:hypothetical protein
MDSAIECNHDGIRQEWILRFQIILDLVDMGNYFGPLIPTKSFTVVATDPRYGTEIMQLFSIHGETVKATILSLPDLKSRQLQHFDSPICL